MLFSSTAKGNKRRVYDEEESANNGVLVVQDGQHYTSCLDGCVKKDARLARVARGKMVLIHSFPCMLLPYFRLASSPYCLGDV